MADDDKPWLQRAGEPLQAYNAFCLYLGLPKRSVEAAYAKHLSPEKRKKRAEEGRSNKASGQWNRWSVMYEWKARALAYDQHRHRDLRELREEAERRALVLVYERFDDLVQHAIELALGERTMKMTGVVMLRELLGFAELRKATGERVPGSAGGLDLEKIRALESKILSGEMDGADPRELAAQYFETMSPAG